MPREEPVLHNTDGTGAGLCSPAAATQARIHGLHEFRGTLTPGKRDDQRDGVSCPVESVRPESFAGWCLLLEHHVDAEHRSQDQLAQGCARRNRV